MRNEKGQQKKGDIQINQGAKKGEEIKRPNPSALLV